ncbi:MAG: hypothetical protein WC948_00670 [Thermovirgaceae bacterium]
MSIRDLLDPIYNENSGRSNLGRYFSQAFPPFRSSMALSPKGHSFRRDLSRGWSFS